LRVFLVEYVPDIAVVSEDFQQFLIRFGSAYRPLCRSDEVLNPVRCGAAFQAFLPFFHRKQVAGGEQETEFHRTESLQEPAIELFIVQLR
jgi:hypothetical protein